MEWLFSVPVPLLGILITSVFVLVALTGMGLAHRLFHPLLPTSAHDNEFIGVILHGMLVIYGLAIGLIALDAWENYADANRLVSAEATAIAMLYRDVGFYPDPVREQLREGLQSYTEHVVQKAWPEQRRGRVPDDGGAIFNRIQSDLYAFAPTTESQILGHSEALHAFNRLIEARRMRLDVVRSGLPAAMWTVVLLGALICFVATYLFRVDNRRLQYTLVGLLAGLTGLVVFLILIFDSPFRGTHGVSPEAYELVLRQLMTS